MTGWSSWRRASRAALSWPHRALKSRGAVNQVGERIPLVVVNREVPWLSGLLIDTPSGLAQALDYLVSLGHLRIAYVRGPATSWTDEARYRALRTAAQQHSVELVQWGHSDQPCLLVPLRQTPSRSPGSLPLYSLTTHWQSGHWVTFRQRGIRVPEDLSVVGCDDIFGASFTSPPLTTVTASGEQAGRAAADMLLSSFTMKDRSHRIDHLPTHLTVRESTGPARTLVS